MDEQGTTFLQSADPQLLSQESGFSFGEFWEKIENLLSPLFQNLNPSLFQNVILGILAIFVPFAIVFLTEVLNDKKERDDFEKLVLNDEVFETKKIFGIAVFGIFFFSFFSEESAFISKIISIVVIFLWIFLFWRIFRKILKFSEGEKRRFEISFLKKLHSKDFKKMKISWKRIWSEKTEFQENEFTDIFISHIDQAIEKQEYQLAEDLTQIYLENIEKRNSCFLAEKFSPKILEWDFRFWKEEKGDLKTTQKKLSLRKKFPKLRRGIDFFFTPPEKRFWDWFFFSENALKKMIPIVLENQQYSFFEFLEYHVKEHKNNDFKYIEDFFQNFYPFFFEEILKGEGKFSFGFWDQFPSKWKITKMNLEQKEVALLTFYNFYQWIADRRQTDDNFLGKRFYIDRIFQGIFPEVDPKSFGVFFLFTIQWIDIEKKNEVEEFLKQGRIFGISTSMPSFQFTGEISDEEFQKKADKHYKNRKKTEQKETINLAVYLLTHFKIPNKHFFHPDNFQKMMNAFRSFKTEPDSSEEDFKNTLLTTFQEIEDKLITEKHITPSSEKKE